MRSLLLETFVLALTAGPHIEPISCPVLSTRQSNDPYHPCPRSKGAKARNRRYRTCL